MILTSAEVRHTTIDSNYSSVHRLPDGTEVRLRLLRPGDRDALLAGFRRLSPESRYRRFFSPTPRLTESMLRRLFATDDWNHLAIVAERAAPSPGPEDGLGIARFFRLGEAPDTAEAAVVVIDDMQRRGLGRLLLGVLVTAARERGITKFRAHVLPDNEAARRLLHDLDAGVEAQFDGGLRIYELPLPEPAEGMAGDDLVFRFLRFAAEGVQIVGRALTPRRPPPEKLP